MPDMWMDVDTALAEVPVNLQALTDDTDFKTREEGIVYNQAGMDLVWNFVTTAGAFSQTAVTPTTGGDYDWAHQGNAMYTIEIPASGGASINNDTEGFGWFTGICTGVLHWRGPVIGFRAAGINNLMIDSAYSATRGLAGTALPAAAADAAGGLPISDAGGLDLDTQLANTHEITAARMGALTDWINGGRLDLILDEILVDTGTTLPTNQTSIYDRIGAPAGASIAADLVVIDNFVDELESRLTAARAQVLTDWINGGRLDLILDIIAADVANVDGSSIPSAVSIRQEMDLNSTRLDANISTRSSHTAANVWEVGTRTLTSFGTLVADIWNRLTSLLTTAGSIGKLIVDFLNASVSSRSSHTAANVWEVGTRTLTAGTKDSEIDAIKVTTDKLDDTLEDDVGIYRFTENALEQAPSGVGGATEAKQDTMITHLTELKGAGFVEATDSNEAIRNRGDAAWGGSAASFVGLQGGLLLNFRVNEKSGLLIYDNMHSEYKGMFVEDEVTFVEGVKGKALNFTGVSGVNCQIDWKETKYSGNPLIVQQSSYEQGLYTPCIIDVGSEIWCYHNVITDDQPQNRLRVGLSISTNNGESFTFYGYVLEPSAGEWDSVRTYQANVIYDSDDSVYKMWYNGDNDVDYGIGYATSPDGKNWTKYGSAPVFDQGSPGDFDDYAVATPCVLKESGTFYMFYTGMSDYLINEGMGLASSADGITWTRVQTTPVLAGTNFNRFFVKKYNNVYYVIFKILYNDTKLYAAYSTDKINWTLNYHPWIRLDSNDWLVDGDPVDTLQDAGWHTLDDTEAKFYYAASTIVRTNDKIGRITIPNFIEKVQETELLNQYPISICCWVKTTDSGTGRGLVKRGLNTAPLNAFSLYVSSGRLKAFYSLDGSNYVNMTADIDDGGIINDGLWHHIIFTVDSGGGELFVDLVSQNTKAWTGTPGATTSTELLKIGEYTNVITGQIDDIRIYDHALSSDERRGIVIGIPYLEDNTLEIVIDQETTNDEIAELQGTNFDPALHSNKAIIETGNANWGKLTGSNAITINIKDQNSNNVVECAVEIWDEDNTSFYERKTTDSNGNTSHNIDDGTYIVRIHKAGYIFTDKTLVVTTAATVNYTGTTVIIGTPADPDACRVYDYAFEQDDETPVASLDACCFITSLPYDYDGKLHSGERKDATYDSETGLFYWDIVKGATVKFHVKHFGYINKSKVIPALDQARLSDIED